LIRRGVWILAGALVLAFVVGTAKFFFWPSTSEPRRVDAIVVFGARSRPERLPEGLRLANQRVAPVLVLSAPPEDRSICRGMDRLEVICFRPEPFSTRGEARRIGELAADRGWKSILLVTSTYHLTRARMLLRRCLDGSVEGIAADPRDGVERTIEQIAHEWAGLVHALTVARDC
jgi:uncharacterized SAM-binding protein YcdF (DUF218 family)